MCGAGLFGAYQRRKIDSRKTGNMHAPIGYAFALIGTGCLLLGITAVFGGVSLGGTQYFAINRWSLTDGKPRT